MIRMSVHMHAIRAEETDQMLRALDGPGGADFVLLVAEARAGADGNGATVPFREHDLQTLIERRVNGARTMTLDDLARTLDELEAMG